MIKCNFTAMSQLMYAYIDAGCFAILGRIRAPGVFARVPNAANVGRLPLDLSRCTAARQLKGNGMAGSLEGPSTWPESTAGALAAC